MFTTNKNILFFPYTFLYMLFIFYLCLVMEEYVMFTVNTLHKSLIYIVNSFGPRIEPCGIPHHVVVVVLNLCHLTVRIILLLR